MKPQLKLDKRVVGPDQLLARITSGSPDEGAQLQAFRQALVDLIRIPSPAVVAGEPVTLVGFVLPADQRRGLTALCLRQDGRECSVQAADLSLPQDTAGSRYLDAFRKWMEPALPPGTLELAILSVKQKAARCRIPGTDRIVTLRASRLRDAVPGEIALVKAHKQWTYAASEYCSGEIESARLDAAALGLVPLRLHARDPGSQFEMEHVLPGVTPADPDHADSLDPAEAYKILMYLCRIDLRCLDAHAHLGRLVFEENPGLALRHYEVGFRIGELSLAPGFDGLLPWDYAGNRPFMRCMHGFGMCLRRLDRFEEAARLFERMLSLNPADNQGVRTLLE